MGAADRASPATGTPLRAELARKAIHLGTAILPVGLSVGWVNLAELRILLSAALVTALAIEGLRATSPAVAGAFARTVGPLLRRTEDRGITGATWLALAMCVVAWTVPTRSATVALWAAAVGDASGALLGRGVQAWRGVGGGKSLAGSLAVVTTTTLGALWLTGLAPVVAVALGAAAAIAEWPRRPLDDNLRVALVVALAAVLLGVG